MHDPFVGFQISCDWKCHVTRNPPSAGGTDYRMSVGTPIRAAFDGVLTNRPPVQYPASGNVAILTRADGLAFYHLHLSQFVAPGRVSEGQVIGYSGGALGAPGSGASTGPHVHVNAYFQGAMRDIHDFFTTAPAGGTGTPIGVDMPLSQDDILAIWSFQLSNMLPDGSVGPVRARAADWLTATASEATAVAREKSTVVRDSTQTDILRADLNTLHTAISSIPAGSSAAPVDTAALIAQLRPLFDALPAAVRNAIIK